MRSMLSTLFASAFFSAAPGGVFVVDGLLFIPEFVFPFFISFGNPVFFLFIILMEDEFVFFCYTVVAVKVTMSDCGLSKIIFRVYLTPE